MGFFKKHFKPAPNKYINHPDVLEKMGDDLAVMVMKQLKYEIHEGYKRTTWIKIECSWAISLDSKPEDYVYSSDRFTGYSIHYSDYGMDNVPEDDGDDFLDALLPYFKKQCLNLSQYFFPDNTVSVHRTTYQQVRKDDGYIDYPAIEISVIGSIVPSSSKSTYTPW